MRSSHRTSFRLVVLAVVTIALGLVFACEAYEPPPIPTIVGLRDGVLTDSRAPLIIAFGTPVDEVTVVVKVAFNDTDVEGNLGDEDDDPDTQTSILVARDPFEGDRGVRASFIDGGSALRLDLDAALPVGPKLVLVVEGGLTSTSGRVSKYRIKIPFSFTVQCASRSPTKLTSGTYFALLDVEAPIGTQIQLFGVLDVDPATGALTGQFTNADRNPDKNRCPSPCSEADTCRLLPMPACVAPSTRAGTVDEYPDFVPNAAPPTGYSFFVEGCAVDDTVATGVRTAPATMVVESPAVTIDGLVMTGQFTTGASGPSRASGSLTADSVRLGSNPVGPGKGTMTAVRIPDDAVPPDLPRPPPPASVSGARDGGSDGGN